MHGKTIVAWRGVAWCDVPAALGAGPVVLLNRVIAVAESGQPALAQVEPLGGLEGYFWWNAGRAELWPRGTLTAVGAREESTAAAAVAAGMIDSADRTDRTHSAATGCASTRAARPAGAKR